MEVVNNKIKTFFKEKFNLILFLIIFAIVCVLYNQNNQTLNFFLKRGTVLEYSIDSTSKIDYKKIEKKLLEYGIKYSYVNDGKIKNNDIYDSDEKKINNILNIGLPILVNENKKDIFNNISDYIFDTYENSKLLNIKTLNDNYHKPFNTFVRFFNLLITSLITWLCLLTIISKDKNVIKNFYSTIKSFLNKQKDSFIQLIKSTKEKGIGYFFKKILFEESNDDTKEINMTKEIINTIFFVIIAVILIRYFIGELRWIPSGSMRPTILEKDRVFVEKIDIKKDIKRGDILVFYPPESKLSNDFLSVFSRLSGIMCKDIAFIKRAIGMPNDKFEVKYNEKTDEYRVYINDIALNEPYAISKSNWTPCNDEMYCGPFVIPDGHYFMMGDNRGNSQDSRFWGFLEENRIIGRANFMFWPISRINVLTDKYITLHKEKSNKKYINNTFIVNRYEFLYKI